MFLCILCAWRELPLLPQVVLVGLVGGGDHPGPARHCHMHDDCSRAARAAVDEGRVTDLALTPSSRRPRSLASAAAPQGRLVTGAALIDRERQTPRQRRLGAGERDSRTTISAPSASSNAASYSPVSAMNAKRCAPPGVGSLTCSTATRRPPAARPALDVRYSVRALCTVAEEGNQPGARTRCASSAAGARRWHGGLGAHRACHPGGYRVRG